MPVLLYLCLSFFIIKDYGITWDEPGNFGVGHKYLYFYQTGHFNLLDAQPEIEGHRFYSKLTTKISFYSVLPFPNILSAITCYLFYQRPRLLDPISAHHIIIPILTAFFLYILFLFVRKYWSNSSALISVLALISYPDFFGHSFNNIKDMPEVIFFSLTIIIFVEWAFSKRIKYLYLAFVCFGLALTSKYDAVFIPMILILWQLPFFYKCLLDNCAFKFRTLLHIFIGLSITFLIIFLCYPPLQPWAYAGTKQFLLNAINFIYNTLKYAYQVGRLESETWNLYAPAQIFYRTPVVMLGLFILGFIVACFKLRQNKMHRLLIIWLLFPLARHCLPRVNHYDGLRHFLVFLVPFSIIIAIGVANLAEKCARCIRVKKILLLVFICILFLIPNIYSLITLHPYQTAYFNSLVAGLKGAQEKDIPFSYDYWLHSYREAARWLEGYGQSKAIYYAHPYPDLFRIYISREDLNPISIEQVSQNLPANTYVIMVYRNQPIDKKILSIVMPVTKVAYQIKRQGGVILTIYYKP
jgi:4-amino-4-deoxy-L-arabinose transferase-like glycosyltransferase